MDKYRIISTPAVEVVKSNGKSIMVAVPEDISLYKLNFILDEQYPNHKDIHYGQTIGILNFYKE